MEPGLVTIAGEPCACASTWLCHISRKSQEFAERPTLALDGCETLFAEDHIGGDSRFGTYSAGLNPNPVAWFSDSRSALTCENRT